MARAADDPFVIVFARTCRRYSPFLSDDGLDNAVEDQIGVPTMASGRDLLTYDLDRAAAVSAGLLSDDEPTQVIEFVVVIDAIDPWMHSVRLDIIGPDDALAPFGTYPPFTGQDGSLTISWAFSAFNAIDNLDEVDVGHARWKTSLASRLCAGCHFRIKFGESVSTCEDPDSDCGPGDAHWHDHGVRHVGGDSGGCRDTDGNDQGHRN